MATGVDNTMGMHMQAQGDFLVGSAYHCASQKKLQVHQTTFQNASQVVTISFSFRNFIYID